MDEQSQTSKGKYNPILVILPIAILAGVGLLAFKGSPQESKMDDQPTKQEVQAETTTTMDSVYATVAVEAGSFYYKPNIIKVKKGTIVKLTLNSVSMMHDFNVDELNVHVPITKSGSSVTAEFTADKTGEFEYYCSVGSHRKMGQVGKLIVE